MKQSKIIKFSIITITLLLIDIISKYIFYDLRIGEYTKFLQPTLNIGIARSIPVPLLITIIISIIVLITLTRLFYRKYLSWIITSLLIAGTLGNLIDRIIINGVKDFINIQIFNFPIFNVADVLLNIWILLVIIHVIFPWKKKTKK